VSSVTARLVPVSVVLSPAQLFEPSYYQENPNETFPQQVSIQQRWYLHHSQMQEVRSLEDLERVPVLGLVEQLWQYAVFERARQLGLVGELMEA
jgi:hypothetical protein